MWKMGKTKVQQTEQRQRQRSGAWGAFLHVFTKNYQKNKDTHISLRLFLAI